MYKIYNKAWGELKEVHKKHLEKYNVKLPTEGTAKQLWLAILYHAYKQDPQKDIDKNEISRITAELLPSLAADQQVRHLKRDGWNIDGKKRGYHRFLDPHKPSPAFYQEGIKRARLLSAKDFDDIKKAHRNRCATCGAEDGKKHWQYQETVKLQEAHQDPAKPHAQGNIIPQCQFCNQSYRDNFTFDDKGRVRAIASIEPVRRASARVKKEVLEFLKKLLDN